MDFSPNWWGKEGNMEAKNTYSLEIAFIFQKIAEHSQQLIHNCIKSGEGMLYLKIVKPTPLNRPYLPAY